MKKNQKILSRIVIGQKIMVGKPIIKGTRLTVQHILGLLAQGVSMDDILLEYKGLERDDIVACLMFAASTLENTTLDAGTVMKAGVIFG